MKISTAFSLTIIFAIMVCCSDDSPTETPAAPVAFFNLNVGNEWVYKRYNYDPENPLVYTDSGIIDSVNVESVETLNGLQFSKILHRRFQDNQFLHLGYAYQRVNNLGFLVGYSDGQLNIGTALPQDLNQITEDSGTLLHPGTDSSYFNDVELFQSTATLIFQPSPITSVTIEGAVYTVIPLIGYYTPPGATVPTRTAQFDYEQQTGLVRSQMVPVEGSNAYEYRLLSYEIVP